MDTRNVQLTLEKAKEWYQKGGELKEVALQAFSEKELKDPMPKSWEEYCELQRSKHAKGYFIDSNSNIYETNCGIIKTPEVWKSVLPSKELAKAFLAMMQLMSLRQSWIKDWEPDWSDSSSDKYCVTVKRCNLEVVYLALSGCPLSFPTIEMAEDFKECFKELLEEAKGLY